MLSSRRGGGTCSSKAASNHSHLDSLLTLTCCSEGKEICLPDPQTLFWGLPYYFPNSFQMWRPYPAILFFPPFPFLSLSASSHSHLLADLRTWGPDSHLVCFSQSKNPVLWIASAWRVGMVESAHFTVCRNLPTVTSFAPFLDEKRNPLLVQDGTFSDSWQLVASTECTWNLLHVLNSSSSSNRVEQIFKYSLLSRTSLDKVCMVSRK